MNSLEVLNIAILSLDMLLPIKLINIQGMCIVHIIITSQSPKVGDNTFTSLDAIIMKCPSLPLGKRKGYLEMHSWEVTWFKGCWTFYAIEVIVEA